MRKQSTKRIAEGGGKGRHDIRIGPVVDVPSGSSFRATKSTCTVPSDFLLFFQPEKNEKRHHNSINSFNSLPESSRRKWEIIEKKKSCKVGSNKSCRRYFFDFDNKSNDKRTDLRYLYDAHGSPIKLDPQPTLNKIKSQSRGKNGRLKLNSGRMAGWLTQLDSVKKERESQKGPIQLGT